MTAQEAIERSTHYNEIVLLMGSPDLIDELLTLSDDHVYNEMTHMWGFWGEDDNGDYWRIHVKEGAP